MFINVKKKTFINIKKKRLLTFLASKRKEKVCNVWFLKEFLNKQPNLKKEKIETFFNVSNKGKSFLTKLNSPNLKMLVNFYKRKLNVYIYQIDHYLSLI